MPTTYPAAFEEIWSNTGKRGVKYAAFKAWEKVGRPSWGAFSSHWSSYLLSERPAAGFVKDLSSWLNGRGHEQDWEPAKPRTNGAVVPFAVKVEQDRERRLNAEAEERMFGRGR